MSEFKTEPAQDVTERIRSVTEEVLEGSAHYLVDVQVRGNKGSRVVEIYVDGDEGVGIDELARINREVGFLLETDEVIAGRYNLNVSSPGIDRPLTQARQFRKNVGRRLSVKRRTEEGNTVVEEGELVSATEDGIALQISPSKQLTVPFGDLIEARVQLPW